MAVSALQLGELALHGAAFLCGVVCASALTVTQGEFGGRCILYGSVDKNGTALALSHFSNISLCYFVTAISILIAVYCFAVLLYGIYSCCMDERRWDHTWLTVNLAISAVILFFLLVSACILRVGMDTLCSSILQTKLVKSCQEAQHSQWFPQYNAARFYDNLYSAEAAAWVNFFFWCLLMVLMLVQRRQEAPFQLLQRNDPEWSSETDAIFGARPQRP
ncbi:transmembrane protein 179B isoform X1 [Terrapene carolina triunguis]|uniref:Transmembrane protein 179B n=1 Tax=Terrapene triunguis TaxID=2587831 RepID=A0A674IMX0_9SAUR|nr:transmembrane protein 179B isoform X1 [Terrapene carolina triunguis]